METVIEVRSFYGTQQTICTLTCGQKQIQFLKRCALYFSEYQTMHKVLKKKTAILSFISHKPKNFITPIFSPSHLSSPAELFLTLQGPGTA
jgi:hypothetical protein